MITVYGKKLATLEQIRKVPLVRPLEAGQYWQGLRHGELLDAILDETHSRRWKVVESRFTLSTDRADLAGAIELEIPNTEVPQGQRLALGILTSNARRHSLKMTVGSVVRVCQNGLVTGEIVMARKHTSGFDIHEEVEHAFDSYLDRVQDIPKLVSFWQHESMSYREVEHVLMEAGRKHIMPWSRVGLVDHEYRNPRFEEYGSGTVWTLLNAFTFIVKRNPPLQQMEQINKFRELLPSPKINSY